MYIFQNMYFSLVILLRQPIQISKWHLTIIILDVHQHNNNTSAEWYLQGFEGKKISP